MANLFGKKVIGKVSVVEHHQQASDKAFKVFKDTLEDLTEANYDIKIDIAAQQSIIAEAKARENALLDIEKRNADLHGKIAKFFDI